MTSSGSSKKIITIVTGLPRSGTSMVMQMLEAGGLEPLMDDHMPTNIDNPGGYYEYESIGVLPWDNTWVLEATGKALKVLAAGISHLPEDLKYKVIFITRDADEMRISLKKLLIRNGVDTDQITQAEIDLRRGHGLKQVQRWAERTGNEILVIDYNETLKRPLMTAGKISHFLGYGTAAAVAMADAVNPKYYRNRVVGL